MDRQDVIAENRKRKQLRSRFLSDASATASYLHPKNVTGRWKNKQKAKLNELSYGIGTFTKQNRVLITALGAGGLLLASFRPILKAVQHFRAKQDKTK